MKKILSFAALALLFLSSCQKGMTPSAPSQEIRFVVVDTKAFAVTTASTLQTGGFKVAAIYDSDHSAMFNAAVAYDSGSSSFTVPGQHYYFPESQAMSFYGVYPADETIAVDATTGKATLTYSHNPDDDLITAAVNGVSKSNTPSGSVGLVFGHALSQLSVTAKGEEPTVDYKLMNLTVTAADGGVYDFSDGTWTLNTSAADHVLYDDASGMGISTSDKTAVGSALSVMPGDVKVRAKWTCYNKGTSIIVNEKDVTIDVTLVKGESTTLDLTLPFNGTGLSFSTTVGAWLPVSSSAVMKYKPELLPGVFTVCASPLKKVKFAKGNLFWNGEEFSCEANQYDYPTSWDVSHVGYFHWSKDARVAYAADYYAANTEFGITPATTDTFFAADGRVFTGFTVLSKDEWRYLINNSFYFSSIPGYTCSMGYFFEGTYEQAKQQYEKGLEDGSIDQFFLEMNTGEEDISFDHLFDIGFFYQENGTKFKNEINGKSCVILKPDGFTGTIADSYTAAEWVEAEKSGLVALPFAGSRRGSSFDNVGSNGYYWSSTPDTQTAGWAYDALFDSFDVYGHLPHDRSSGRSVRLVSVQ